MKRLTLAAFCVFSFVALTAEDCPDQKPTPQTANSGAVQASVSLPKSSDGFTAEQRNVRDRLIEDNKPGAIKHLYIISAYSGQVLIYSTVRGKVTSGSKRLSSTAWFISGAQSYQGYSPELIGDDGTFGQSVEYLYWWDTNGIYHQQYVTGGMILHISSQPLAVKGVVINMALDTSK